MHVNLTYSIQPCFLKIAVHCDTNDENASSNKEMNCATLGISLAVFYFLETVLDKNLEIMFPVLFLKPLQHLKYSCYGTDDIFKIFVDFFCLLFIAQCFRIAGLNSKNKNSAVFHLG